MFSIKKIVLFILLIIITTSCSIQKRQYRSGYYIQWKKAASNVKHIPEKPAQITLKQIELPQKDEPEIKMELIASREFKPVKLPSPVFALPKMAKAENNKKLIRKLSRKVSRNQGKGLVSAATNTLAVLTILFFAYIAVLSRTNYLSMLTFGQAFGIVFLFLLLGLLAILLLIIGLIVRSIKKNKAANYSAKP